MGRKRDLRIEERRARVARLLLERPGIRLAEIARHTGVSVATAHRDVQAVRAEWAAQRVAAYEARLVEDFARTDEAIAAIWPHVAAGKAWAIDRLCSLIQLRMKLLGLETYRHELDVGEVFAQYLVRAADDEARSREGSLAHLS
jgi:predicted DNA-binding transcriptional regulator YafY